jgi:hypothetical protein
MRARKDPASDVVTYFETAPIDTATVVLNIAKGILARRRGEAMRPRLRRVPKPAAVPAPETTEVV